MKNKELFELLPKIELLKSLSGVELAYKIISNKTIIKQQIDIYEEMIQQSSEYKQYDEKRIQLCMEYADLDELEKPIIINNMFQITNRTKFNELLLKLNSENEATILAHFTQQRNGEEFLNKEINITLFKIDKTEIPNNITVEQMDILMNMM